MDEATRALLVLISCWAAIGAGLACLGYVAWASHRNSRLLREAGERYKKALRSEWLARMRHRDFEAFCIEVNNIRAERGQEPIPKELLRKVQYNLMYTIDGD
ncbi:MAG: hypothetical protein ACUVV6_02865 [Thermoplasmatota archaeon]